MSYYQNSFFDKNKSNLFDKVPLHTNLKKDITVSFEKYFNEENGFGIYVVTDDETNSEFDIKGNFPTRLIINQTYAVEGEVAIYKGVKQLLVHKTLSTKPRTKKGILMYLKTLNQISEKRALLIYDTFGADSIDILIKHPERVVSELPRVKEKLANLWMSQLKDMFETQEVMIRLYGFGLSVKEAKKIYEKYGENIIDRIEENP
ncbi:MAG: hypothetical protein IJH34_15050, partial [Romboutsia sp.]|nr:hypothetical protein [Romboutsia sp.]